MKVLFVTRSYIGLSQGGLSRQIERTVLALEDRNVEVIRFNPWENQIPDVDVCHFFSTDSQMVYYTEATKLAKKPIVMSPVFGYCQIPAWKMRLKVAFAHKIPGFGLQFVALRKMFDAADRILVLNQEERERLQKIMCISQTKCAIIPNGIDKKFVNADPSLCRGKYGLENFILTVGSIDSNKNQLAVIEAVRNLPYKYVIVGQALTGHDAYARKCKTVAGDNVIFLGQIAYDDPMLASLYAAAKVFVLPSRSEVMPLSIYEAAQAGCTVITSDNVPVAPDVRRFISSAKPEKPAEFRKLIKAAMLSEPDPEFRQKVLAMPAWHEIADKIKNIYQQLLSKT